MKSLEIVNETYEYAYDKKNDCYPFFKREVEIIKADLEVLEILKSKLLLNHCPEKYPLREAFILVFVERTNKELACEVTKEEYNKLKQWLGENENDR